MLCLIQIIYCEMQCRRFYRIGCCDCHCTLCRWIGYADPFYSGYGTGILCIQIRIEHSGYGVAISSNRCEIFSVPHSLYRAVTIPFYVFISFRQFHNGTDTDITSKACSGCVYGCIYRHCTASVYLINHGLFQVCLACTCQCHTDRLLSCIVCSDRNIRSRYIFVDILPVSIIITVIVVENTSPVIRNRSACQQSFTFVYIIFQCSGCFFYFKAEIGTGNFDHIFCTVIYGYVCVDRRFYFCNFCRNLELLVSNFMSCFCPQCIFFELYRQIQIVFCSCFLLFRHGCTIRNFDVSALSACNIGIFRRKCTGTDLFAVLSQCPCYVKIIQIQEVVFIVNVDGLAEQLAVICGKPYALILIFYFIKFRLNIPVRRYQTVYTEGVVVRAFAGVSAVSIEVAFDFI